MFGVSQGQYITMKRHYQENVVDLTVDQEIHILLEKTSTGHILKNTEYNDFSVRRQAYSCTKSITYLIYFPYVAINKTNVDLKLTLIEEKEE